MGGKLKQVTHIRKGKTGRILGRIYIKAKSIRQHLRRWSSGNCDRQRCRKAYRLHSWKMCQYIRRKPFSYCKRVMNACSFEKRCEEAACRCLESGKGWKRCKCSVLTMFAKECIIRKTSLKTVLQDGLNKHKCTPACGKELVYNLCIKRTCQRKCSNLKKFKCPMVKKMCASGCRCPSGLVMKKKRCVRKPHCRDCKCSGSTDGAHETFDKQSFSFKAKCTYLALRDKKNHMRVFVTYKYCHGRSRRRSQCHLIVRIWAVNGKRIAIYKGRNWVRAYVGGRRYGIPYRSKQVRIRRIKGGVAVLNKAIQLEVLVFQDLDNPYVQNFKINIPRALYKKTRDRTEGLCGVCAGPGTKGKVLNLRVRGKRNSRSIKKYTVSWLAKFIARQFRHERDCSVKPPVPCKHTDRQNKKLCTKLYRLKRKVFRRCPIKVHAFVRKCQRLICSKRSWRAKLRFGCKIISEYAAKCCASGKRIGNWRYWARCPRIRCKRGTGKVYRVCGPGCDKTCKRKRCSRNIRRSEGCYCRRNQRWNGKRCIWKRRCPICRGHILGQRWRDLRRCRKCHCRAGGKIVCRRLCRSKKKCKWYQRLAYRRRYGKCCKICKCRRPCPKIRRPKCKRLGEIPIVYRIRRCGCMYYKCRCVKRTCKPRPRCTRYQRLKVYKKRESCCKTYNCHCIGVSRCPKRWKPKCRWDQKRVKYYDKSRCCVTAYRCRCDHCKSIPLPKCRRDQRLRQIPSPCKCLKFKCRCKNCPYPPRCGRYARRIRLKVKNRCCASYVCQCIRTRCPPISSIRRICREGQVLKRIYDSNRKCCLLGYYCPCKKCRTTKKKKCRKDQKLVLSKTRCGCNKYRCVCNRIKCPRIPRCTRYQYRREVRGGTKPCCRMYECVCKPLPKCPKVRKPKCPEFMRIKKTVDRNQCCVVRKTCTCAGVKCHRYAPRCGRYRKLQTIKARCGCRKYKCICAREKCSRVTCTRYQRMAIDSKDKECCPRRFCVCLPFWRCPPLRQRIPRCRRDQVLKPIRDRHKCCITYYKCVCKRCKRPRSRRCKKFQVRVEKRNVCGCITYKCVCSNVKCQKKPRNCGKYGSLITYRTSRRACCKKYRCICAKNKCPRYPKRIGRKCVDEQVLKPVSDGTNCCTKYYVCKCRKPLRCKRFSRKYCGVGETLQTRRSACGCKIPVCVCQGSTLCPRRPRCGRYQVLKKLRIKSNKCCTVYTCVCRKRRSCPRVRTPRCVDEQVLRQKYDSKGCCIVRKFCKCRRCPMMRRPRCRKHMRLQNRPTKCCNYYGCVCNRASCPVKKCTKHQRITETKLHNRCCPRQGCVCDPRRCPVQKLRSRKACPDGQIIKVKWTKDGCCLLYYCACPRCPPVRAPRCGRTQRQLRDRLPCNCVRYRCICDKTKCPRQRACQYYEMRVLISIQNRCCPRYKCVCNKARCRRVRPNPKKCKAEQKLVPILDPSKCCTLRYKCVCVKCPQRKTPACQRYETVLIKRSRCGCRRPTCVCDRKIRCPAIPRCSKLQKLVITEAYKCCKRYECICKGVSYCPKIKTPRCKDEQVIKARYDKNNCCEERRDCVCPKRRCPRVFVPRCGRYKRRKTIRTACCYRYTCVCDRKRCPRRRCSRYQTLVKTPTRGCCPKLTCVCDGRKCPRNVRLKKCPVGMKLVPVTDYRKCCIRRYTCLCLKCPHRGRRIRCKRRQRVVYRLTRCRCHVPKCLCDWRKCPRKKKCDKYLVLKSKKPRGACCRKYRCECTKRCPRVWPRRCGPDRMAVPVRDKNECCIIRYICECKICKRYNRKPCENYEKLEYHRTRCGCQVPKCICNHTIVCHPAPRCKRYEKLRKRRTSNKCCKKYDCVCKGLRYCRRIRRPRCTREQKVVTVKGKCCIKRRYCKCKKCPPMKVPKCTRFQTLKIKPTLCCTKFTCACDKSRCHIKICPKYHKKISFHVWRRCCPKQKCVCKPRTCPKESRKIKCRRDQYLAFRYDRHKCCKKFYCKCRPCKHIRTIRCKKSQSLALTLSRCGCRKYKCVCNKNKCKHRPRCSKYTRLTVVQEAKKCCPTYKCRCIDRKKCPKVKADIRKCKDEQYLKPVYDSSHCCVKRWVCVCSTCRPITIPPCENYQRVEYDESACHCPKPKCVCNDRIRCKPKPICTKYQVLRTSNTSDPCCERHECVCKGLSECPAVATPKCEGEEYVADVPDNNNCCIVKKICKCPKKCPKVKTTKCKKGERLVAKETKCCVKKKCVCDLNNCKRKQCGKCMFAVALKIRSGCCPVETCVCNATCCPPVKFDPSTCKDEQRLKAMRDNGKCCITRYICECGDCKPPSLTKCKRNQMLIRRFSVCGCKSYKCVCSPRSCPRIPTCGRFETLTSKLKSGECCVRYSCRCNKSKCPPLTFNPKKCKDEQKLVSVTDKKGCCITKFKCKCQKCTPPKKKKCGKFKKVRIIKTVCGCPNPVCICSKVKCPRMPTCSKFQEVRSYKTSKCCYTHKCVCKGLDKCPEVKTPKCKGDERVVTKVDQSKCCIIKKTCKCPKRCPKKKKPKCRKDQRLTWKKTKCCKKPKCVCAKDKCKQRPKCARFEKLKKFKIAGKCCPIYVCLPPKGCVVMDEKTKRYLLKKKNSKWKENACRKCKCEKPVGGFEAKCTDKKCPKCPKTHKIIKRKGHCCPKCVPKGCVMGKKVLRLGFEWSYKCLVFKCIKKFGRYIIHVRRRKCKQVPFCIMKALIPPGHSCFYCPTCEQPTCKDPKAIIGTASIGYIKVKDSKGKICENKGIIRGLTQCVGTCEPKDRKLKDSRSGDIECLPSLTMPIAVKLTCPGGKTILHYHKNPSKCKCKRGCKCKP